MAGTPGTDAGPAFEAYYRALRGIGDELMRIFAIALGIDEHWFDDRIARSISEKVLGSRIPEEAAS